LPGRRAAYSLTEASIPLVPVFAQFGEWRLRHRPAGRRLRVRAELLAAGGPELWKEFMAELRAIHLGEPAPERDGPGSWNAWPTPTPPRSERLSRGCAQTRPRRCAVAAASPRLVTSSLARMLETCTLAVLAEMNSSPAISRLLRPSATSRSTSSSRGVSPSE
jgi:hypothetical protein